MSKRRLRRAELAVAGAVILLAVVGALSHVRAILLHVERQSLATSLAVLRASLMNRAMVALVDRDHRAMAALASADPRIGTSLFTGPTPRGQGRGGWRFDAARKLLFYHHVHEQGEDGAPRVSAFAVRLRYRDRDGDGRYDPATDRFEAITLVQVLPVGRAAGEGAGRSLGRGS